MEPCCLQPPSPRGHRLTCCAAQHSIAQLTLLRGALPGDGMADFLATLALAAVEPPVDLRAVVLVRAMVPCRPESGPVQVLWSRQGCM